MKNLTARLQEAVENSPSGIITLDVLESLKLCDDSTLKTILSRLVKSERALRLKRGVYASNPVKDQFVAAQSAFNGYIGFSAALYIHRLIAEMPFVVTVVTTSQSGSKRFGTYEFRAVALKEKAIGFESIGNLVVSTRAKTLFDCIYLERYSIEEKKLIEAYIENPLSAKELKEFDSYVQKFASQKTRRKFLEVKKMVAKG
ncbi:MAG: hypothetical protein M1286_04435 [Candidatus Marsarchaeota archaeon]|nr:hypothetical protein [Candidatus Marsarchaeota archaeon]